MVLSEKEYTAIIAKLMMDNPELNIHDYGYDGGNEYQTDRIELLSASYKDRFVLAVNALKFLLPKFDKPEPTSAITASLNRRHPDLNFHDGIVAAAALYLECKIIPYIPPKYTQNGVGNNCSAIHPKVWNEDQNVST